MATLRLIGGSALHLGDRHHLRRLRGRLRGATSTAAHSAFPSAAIPFSAAGEKIERQAGHDLGLLHRQAVRRAGDDRELRTGNRPAYGVGVLKRTASLSPIMKRAGRRTVESVSSEKLGSTRQVAASLSMITAKCSGPIRRHGAVEMGEHRREVRGDVGEHLDQARGSPS